MLLTERVFSLQLNIQFVISGTPQMKVSKSLIIKYFALYITAMLFSDFLGSLIVS